MTGGSRRTWKGGDSIECSLKDRIQDCIIKKDV